MYLKSDWNCLGFSLWLMWMGKYMSGNVSEAVFLFSSPQTISPVSHPYSLVSGSTSEQRNALWISFWNYPFSEREKCEFIFHRWILLDEIIWISLLGTNEEKEEFLNGLPSWNWILRCCKRTAAKLIKQRFVIKRPNTYQKKQVSYIFL